MVQSWVSGMTREKLFVLSQGCAVFVLILAYLWWSRSRESTHGFKSRDPERTELPKNPRLKVQDDPLAQAKIKKPSILQLAGISIHAPPHEILGVPINADRATILSAYKSKMKQYHPDRVARPDTQAWQEAQAIATAITAARDALLQGTRGP